jgi:prepilin-type N-terminal cleavage/methylation domain-containing protein
MHPRESDERGYSLTEMMVGCVLIGIAAVATVPNLYSYRETQRLQRASEQVAAACREARSRARSQNHSVFIEYRTADNAFAVVEDQDSDGVEDAGEPVTIVPIPDGLTLQATTFPGDRLLFDARGRAVAGGTVTVRGGSDHLAKRVRVSSGTGQVRIQSCVPSGFESEPMGP